MKKKIIFFAFLLCIIWSVSAQEVIVVGGAGYQQRKDISKTNYGFAEGRLMINLTEAWRFGPYLGYVQYGSNEIYKKPNPASLGKEFEYGLSFDNYGPIGYSFNHYFWTNIGLKDVRDRFEEGEYASRSNTREWFVSGGFFLTDEWKGWFGNNRLMWSYQKPIKENIRATWQNTPLTGIKPYDKEAYRLTLESGIKRWGGAVTFEPLLHLGYGQNYGSKQQYYEIGGGLDLGIFKEWQRDILKVLVYQRTFNGTGNNNMTSYKAVCGEVVFNVSAAYYALRK